VTMELVVRVAQVVAILLSGFKGESLGLTSESSDSLPLLEVVGALSIKSIVISLPALRLVLLADDKDLLVLEALQIQELQLSSPVVFVVLAQRFFAEGHSHVVSVTGLQSEAVLVFTLHGKLLPSFFVITVPLKLATRLGAEVLAVATLDGDNIFR
jgi:hypothetical protein